MPIPALLNCPPAPVANCSVAFRTFLDSPADGPGATAAVLSCPNVLGDLAAGIFVKKLSCPVIIVCCCRGVDDDCNDDRFEYVRSSLGSDVNVCDNRVNDDVGCVWGLVICREMLPLL